MSSTAQIFVRIAAYREFDLVPTLRDMTAMAAEPERLRICICWQRAETESLAEFSDDPRLDVVDVPFADSEGMCWARNLIQQRWDGEDYTLGIDGHHRFIPNWDSTLIRLSDGLRERGHDKPIVTGYAPSFDPLNDPHSRSRDVWLTNFDRFDERGIVFMRPTLPTGSPESPVASRFWSGHFNFAPGAWNREVLTDPDAYFHSEEIVMTVRSWTHGYDLFTPHMTVLWHEYSRIGRICHWDDHADWDQRTHRAVKQYRRLFGMESEPAPADYEYGFGRARSLRDYEKFSGIDFKRRAVQGYTADDGIPPNPEIPDAEWRDSLQRSFSRTMKVDRLLLDRGCDFWSVMANAEDGTELYRHDSDAAELRQILAEQPGPEIRLNLAFTHDLSPASVTVWPHSAAEGWLDSHTEDW